MSIGTRGAVLPAWGKRGYGFAAYNLAVSLKYHSPSIPITLIAQRETMNQVADHSVFDNIIWLEEAPKDPGRFKAGLYKILPYDYSLLLDVDAFCFKPIDSLFDRLIAQGGNYYTFIQSVYGKESPNLLPQMYWAWKDDIWSKYGLNDHKLPACQSSIQFIKKCTESEELFALVEQCFDDPIPLDKLRHQWGGTQPDELYLNIALAILGQAPHIGDDAMWFGNNGSKRPRELEQTHYFLSFFGYKDNIKGFFWDFYDAKLIRMCSSRKGNHIYKQQYIKADKHANKNSRIRSRPVVIPQKPAVTEYPISEGSVHLFMSYFQTGNPSRDRELNNVMQINCALPQITKIFNLGLEYNHPKVTTIPFDRPTYSDFVDAVNQNSGDYNIIANSDIFFTDEINRIKSVDFHNTALALSRYDCKGNLRKLFDYEHSQDTWIFKGQIKPVQNCDFVMGKPGCDNRFAYELTTAGYRVINPSKDIKTYHLHEVNNRSYVEADRVHGNYLPLPTETLDKYLIKRVLIHQPGKVGDIIRCLPIAKHLHDQGLLVEWLCPMEYHHLFRYVDYVKPIAVKKATYDHEIDLSFGIIQNSATHIKWMKERSSYPSFIHYKYMLAGVDVKESFRLKYNRDEKSENNLFKTLGLSDGDQYILCHLNSDYGTPVSVPDSYGVRIIHFSPIESYSIFDWRKVIENAKAIHCIDSSLVNFVDVINTSAELHYYITNKVPLQSDRTYLQKKWETINMMEYVERV